MRIALRKSTVRIRPLKYEQEYTETPQYPPILDTSYEARKRRMDEQWHEKVKALKTVEEKLFEINMPRYYGWKCIMLSEDSIPYNSLSFAQHVTRTHLGELKHLAPYSTDLEEESNKLLEHVKPWIEEALIFEFKYRSRKHVYLNNEEGLVTADKLDNIIGSSIVQQVNRILLGNLSTKVPHLLKCQVETDPRVESFWCVGGMNPHTFLRGQREKMPWLKDAADKPINRWFQYLGSPMMHLRHELPLPAVLQMHESESPTFDVPFFHYDPKVIGFHDTRQLGTNIPGFWPGDACEFGLLSYHHRGHMRHQLLQYGEEDRAEALHAQAIFASYGWLFPQACYQGFSTFSDMTYPLVTQTVITNGKLWSFYVYQLNTTLLHAEHTSSNPRHNLCWGTPELKLFEAIEDGKVIGFNDDVLKYLLNFYLNTPKVREGVEMKPYLGDVEKHIADISVDKRREWLEAEFKHMYSRRPWHILPYEIYQWERIYKIRHQTRPFEARKRPFELQNVRPYMRRYDEHVPRYIPKKFREVNKYKQKFEDTYYP